MAGLTWSTIKTPALASEIRFRFGPFIDRREEGRISFVGLPSAAEQEYARGKRRHVILFEGFEHSIKRLDSIP
jgi:hypothetical protein